MMRERCELTVLARERSGLHSAPSAGKKHQTLSAEENTQFNSASGPQSHLRKRRLSSGANPKPYKPLHLTSERGLVKNSE